MSAPGQPSERQPPFGLRHAAVRRCLLAVTVLHDIDLAWDDATTDPDDGLPDLTVESPEPVRVPAHRLRELLDGCDLEQPRTIERLARWLQLRRALQHVPPALVEDGLRVVGLPEDHPAHPGTDWALRRVAGGALSLGLGVLPDVAPGALPVGPPPAGASSIGGSGGSAATTAPPPIPLPKGLLEEIGVSPEAVWPQAVARLEELGKLAAARRRRRPRDPLRPLAEADVVTLLGSRRFRFELAAESRTGLAGLVVPMLTRGWVSNSSIDSAFGPAAAAATEPELRGFPRPLLVTEYEVVQVPAGGHPLRYLGPQASGSPYS